MYIFKNLNKKSCTVCVYIFIYLFFIPVVLEMPLE